MTAPKRTEIAPRQNINKSSLRAIGLSNKYIDLDVEDFEDKEGSKKKLLKNYVSNIHDMYRDSVNIILTGANGTGKTMLLNIIAKYCYAHYYRVFLGTVTEIMRLRFNEFALTEAELERKELLDGAEFILVDELGKENFTKTRSNIVLVEDLLRTAETKHKTIIIATNLSIEDIETNYGASVHSLIDGNFIKIAFAGEDYRRKITLGKKAVEKLRG